MSEPTPEEQQVAALCRTALERLRGGPLTRGEVRHYLALLDDRRRMRVDAIEPPRDGWYASPGYEEVHVESCARNLLKERGGEELVQELSDHLAAAPAAEARQAVVVLSVGLLGLPNPIVSGLLDHPAEASRLLGLEALKTSGIADRLKLPMILPRLLDASPRVVAAANALMDAARVPCEALPDGAPADIVARARARLEGREVRSPAEPAPPGWPPRLRFGPQVEPAPPPPSARKLPAAERAARLEAFAHVALLAGDLSGLAALLETASADDMRRIVGIKTLTAKHMQQLLALAPALRTGLKAAALSRFNDAKPGRRFSEMPLICLFAPDADVFELGLPELRPDCFFLTSMAIFARADPGLMPVLLEAALENPKSDQFAAAGFAELFRAGKEAFAAALAAMPAAERERHVKALEGVWRTSTERRCIEEMKALMAPLVPQPEKAVRRNRLPPDYTGSGKKPYS